MEKLLKIKCFGVARDITGASEVQLEWEESPISVGQLKSNLEARFVQLRKLKSYFIAVNQEFAEDSDSISFTDELAIIPPVSGG